VEALIEALLNGLVQGLIYVAIAVGLTIVFGTLRLVNFAHGAFYAVGAYTGLVVAQHYGFVTGLIAAPIAVAFFAVVLDRVVLRYFYDKTPTAQILVTFGIALVVEETLRLIFGGTTQQYPTPGRPDPDRIGVAVLGAYRLRLDRPRWDARPHHGAALGRKHPPGVDDRVRARCSRRGLGGGGRVTDLFDRPGYRF
jgi:branched-chain amino acid transport system permease protein